MNSNMSSLAISTLKSNDDSESFREVYQRVLNWQCQQSVKLPDAFP